MTAFLRRHAWRVIAGILACACAGASPAQAASCAINSQDVAFGNYDPFSPSDLDGVGNIRLDCDAVVNVTISLSTGAGSFTSRSMTNGTSTLGYNLFTSPQRIAVWGDGSGGSSTVSANAQTGDFPVYGTIAARQNVTTGTYQDLIVVTVTY